MIMQFWQLDKHLKEHCEKGLRICQNCFSTYVLEKDLISHLRHCKNQLKECLFCHGL